MNELCSFYSPQKAKWSFIYITPYIYNYISSVYDFPQSTAGEMKFAIQVESVLNQISSPEYRQLMVEATMVLSLVAENLGKNFHWDDPIDIGSIVHRANAIFLDEQVSLCIA